MIGPLDVLTWIARPARLSPPIGRCPVCHEDVRDAGGVLTLRGGVRMHRTCATYRTRQRARLH